MADNNMNKTQNSNQPNQTMQQEQAKASVGGSDRKTESGEFDKNRQPEISKTDEKSAIGGQSQDRGQTGEPGRARSELDQNKEFDKSRSETAGSR